MSIDSSLAAGSMLLELGASAPPASGLLANPGRGASPMTWKLPTLAALGGESCITNDIELSEPAVRFRVLDDAKLFALVSDITVPIGYTADNLPKGRLMGFCSFDIFFGLLVESIPNLTIGQSLRSV